MNPESFGHVPVMAGELVQAMRPRDGGRYVDGTLGRAGHAALVLESSGPSGWLLGCDRDQAAIEAAEKRLARFAGRFELRRGNFSELGEWIAAGTLDGVYFDLGVSSPQFDDASLGFSLQRDGPLDMRMDRRQELTAARLVNEADEAELADLFWKLGEERMSRRIARELVAEREHRPFQSTLQLAGLIQRICPRGSQRIHPATRVFQALRMAVNDELGSLELGMRAAWKCLRPGGRLGVITFHSLEARAVKLFGRELASNYDVLGDVDRPEFRRDRQPEGFWVTRKPLEPGETEVALNPRARSAQLRVIEKL